MTRHDHHPNQKYTADDPESENSLPALTYSLVSPNPIKTLPTSPDILTNVPLLQKRQRIRIRPTHIIPKHIRITLVVDIRARKELYRRSDYARDEEDEEYKGEQHHGAWEQFSLRDEGDFDDDEYYGEGADGNAVGHDPGEG